jgi:hypothetical protein
MYEKCVVHACVGVANIVVFLPPVKELAAGRYPKTPRVVGPWSQAPKQVMLCCTS